MIFQNVRYAYQCEFCVSDVCRNISAGTIYSVVKVKNVF
jgi:uncharacterized protein (UPF0179 family)